MTERLRSTLKAAVVASLFVFALGADVQCPGALEAQRTSLANLQAELDELAAIHAPVWIQLVGFTSAGSLDGDEGVLGFTEACQAEYTDSRMCSSVEVMETVDIPALPGNTLAWVRPVYHPGHPAGTDASGVNGDSNPSQLACSGWSNAGGRGLSVDERGRFQHIFCGDIRPQSVACCAAVP